MSPRIPRRMCALALLLGACSSDRRPAPKVEDTETTPPKDATVAMPVSVDAAISQPLSVRLDVQPQQLAMAQRKTFHLSIEVTNTSTAVLDPGLDRSELLVNGEPTIAWPNTIMNSGRSAEWRALPPGRSVGGRWAMGEKLFAAPGDFTLQLRVSDILSPPVQVHVDGP